jgi:AMIN domain
LLSVAKSVRVCLLLLSLAVATASPQNAGSGKKNAGADADVLVTGITVVQEAGLAALEIVCSRPVTPAIRSVDSPPRLVIDLPNTRPAMSHSRIDVLQQNILTIRSQQLQKPAGTRIVVSFLVPYGFAWDADGNRIVVHLKPPKQLYAAKAPTPVEQPRAASLSPAPLPAVLPVTSGVGEVVVADRRFAMGTSLTAGSETAVLQLARGGEVRVCPGTTLSVTPSKNAKELMMGLSTGAMETHYTIGESADSVLTPDFRILFAGPGAFDYAISTDSKGNTCVRGLKGNSSSAIVSELIGDRVYRVKPTEQAVFRGGRIDRIDSEVPVECGCPPPSSTPVLRADAASVRIVPDSDSPNVSLAQTDLPGSPSATANGSSAALSTGPETRPPPSNQASDLHVQVEAPLVFRARSEPPAPNPAVLEADRLPITDSSPKISTLEVQALPPAKATAQPHGIFGRIKGFFAAIFR